MLVCNSGKTYLEPVEKEALLTFLEDVPGYKEEFKNKGVTVVCLGHDLPIGAIGPDTQVIEELADQTHNYHTPMATNKLRYARVWYTIDDGAGPKHGSALSPEWFKLIEGANRKLAKKKPAKLTPQASAFFERMKAEYKTQPTEKTKETVVEPPKEKDESKGKKK